MSPAIGGVVGRSLQHHQRSGSQQVAPCLSGPGGQRRYRRDVLRRVAQRVGLSLEEIGAALDELGTQRVPTKSGWARLSLRWREDLEERIALLEGLRDNLTSCIGCGCLSLRTCKLYNPNDRARRLGTGPRYLLGDSSGDPSASVD
ncbi:MAG: redox-sensitive transcriptional activator SoxR [Acidimicrobiales bacterium]